MSLEFFLFSFSKKTVSFGRVRMTKRCTVPSYYFSSLENECLPLRLRVLSPFYVVLRMSDRWLNNSFDLFVGYRFVPFVYVRLSSTDLTLTPLFFVDGHSLSGPVVTLVFGLPTVSPSVRPFSWDTPEVTRVMRGRCYPVYWSVRFWWVRFL